MPGIEHIGPGIDPVVIRVDGSWKTAREKQSGWTEAAFDDSAWPGAKEVAQFGGGPWGLLGGGSITLSPAKANPWIGHGTIPDGVDLAKSRVYLEADEVAPEAAARVTVNGQFAGGFIGKPLRLEVTRYLKLGVNAIRLDPFAPKAARLAICGPAE